MYKIKVNNSFDFSMEKRDTQLTINDQEIKADIRQLSPSIYHLIHNLGSYSAEVVSFDKDTKVAVIKVNDSLYHVEAKDQYDLLLEKLGLSNLNSVKVSEVRAPMPGLVLKVFVTEGNEVTKGDNLFILEAMKMENIIKSPADGTIKKLKIKPGDKVEKGQVLIGF